MIKKRLIHLSGMSAFPEKIRALRLQKRMSQAELGDIFGISRAAISEWEIGRSAPRLDKLVEISRFFNVALSEIMGTPSSIVSIDEELRRLPEDMQIVLRQSFVDTINSLALAKK